MTNTTHRTVTPQEVASLRARLLAGSADQNQRQTAASLCPTVKLLLERKRKGRHTSA